MFQIIVNSAWGVVANSKRIINLPPGCTAYHKNFAESANTVWILLLNKRSLHCIVINIVIFVELAMFTHLVTMRQHQMERLNTTVSAARGVWNERISRTDTMNKGFQLKCFIFGSGEIWYPLGYCLNVSIGLGATFHCCVQGRYLQSALA